MGHAVGFAGALLLAGGCSALDLTLRPLAVVPPSAFPRSIAVLPFEAPAERTEAMRVVRSTLNNHLSGTTYDVRKLHVIDERLHRERLLSAEDIEGRSPQELGVLLQADALLYGKLLHYDRLYALVYSQVAVGAEVRLVEAASGKVLWTGKETARIHGGGVPSSPWGIVFTAAAAAINLRDVELLHASDDLARRLLETLPVPPPSQARRPPRLERVLADAGGKLLKAGDAVSVILEGEPGLVASFDVLPISRNVAMTEGSDGVYSGRFAIRPGHNAADAYVVARLTDSAGRLAEREDLLGRFAVDTTPPASPTGLIAEARDGKVELRWQRGAERDLAAYRIHRSPTPLTGFTPGATVEAPEFRDVDVDYFRAYHYRVTAIDRAGNESEFSEAATAIPVPPGPTAVRGLITSDTTWRAGSSPYILEEEVLVAAGAVLRIEPGTEIRSRGAALVVRGRLVVAGEPDRNVVFSAVANGDRWPGVLIESAAEASSDVRHCRVRAAEVGITLLAGTVKLAGCHIEDNETGVLVSHPRAALTLRESMVARNRSDGVVVTVGADAEIVSTAIVDNGRDGVRIDGSSPVVRGSRISGNGGAGVSVFAGHPTLRQNRVDGNRGIQVVSRATARPPVDANENFFGTVAPGDILSGIAGRVDVSRVLDGQPPEGKVVVLPVLTSPLQGGVDADAYLIAARSPYLVKGPVTITNGATLYIQAGVVLRFLPGAEGLVVTDGAVTARGTATDPVTFTSASPTPAPGDFRFAVQIGEASRGGSVFEHTRFEYAVTAVRVAGGVAELSDCEIRGNLQHAAEVSGTGALKIVRGVVRGHRNGAALRVSGFGRLSVRASAVFDNAWAVMNHSGNRVDARENWWGSPTPDDGLFLGDVDRRDPLSTR